MEAYKVEILIINFDEISEQKIIYVLENTKFPNRCIDPIVMKTTCGDIGEWDDDHPLNKFKTMVDEYHKIFKRNTGVKDQNGREICEGDIIHIRIKKVSERGEFDDYIEDYDGKVIWKDAAFWIEETPYVKHLLGNFNLDHWTMEIFEIIDNETS